MSEYVLGHHLKGEGKRLALMSELLDPMHRRYIESLDVVKPGAQTLEVGCGNGSISAWLAERVSPSGKAVAFDLDVSLIEVRARNLELRQGDIVAGPVERGAFDLVTARAVLHHVNNVEAAMGIWSQALDRAARFCSLSLIFFLSVSPSRLRCDHSGTAGSRGRANVGSIIMSGALWRHDSQR
jgi:SAM-dependent methyltransferase